MKKLFLLLIFVGTLLLSCNKDEIGIDKDNLLIGVWNFSDYQGNTNIYQRSHEFTNKNCYQFNNDGTLIERKNAGFCGTPPVTYSDYEGIWSILNDTLIEINVGYWGGSTIYQLDIESVNINSLEVQFVYPGN